MTAATIAIFFSLFAASALFSVPVIALAHRYEMPRELMWGAVAMPEGVVALVLWRLFARELGSFEILIGLFGLGGVVGGAVMLVVALLRSRGQPLLRRRQSPLQSWNRRLGGP